MKFSFFDSHLKTTQIKTTLVLPDLPDVFFADGLWW